MARRARYCRGSGRLAEALNDPLRTLVTSDGWKFSCSPTGQHELFNLNTDPGETTNLARRPEHRPRMRELRQRLLAWQRRAGDKVILPEE